MKHLFATLILLIACAVASAQVTETVLTDGRITGQFGLLTGQTFTATHTVIEGELDGKLTTLYFPVGEFWFGSQCAAAESLQQEHTVYDPPFTLYADEKGWRYERKPYSLCEMKLHRTSKAACVGHEDVPHLSPWLKCPAQNIRRQ